MAGIAIFSAFKEHDRLTRDVNEFVDDVEAAELSRAAELDDKAALEKMVSGSEEEPKT